VYLKPEELQDVTISTSFFPPAYILSNGLWEKAIIRLFQLDQQLHTFSTALLSMHHVNTHPLALFHGTQINLSIHTNYIGGFKMQVLVGFWQHSYFVQYTIHPLLMSWRWPKIYIAF
jgi:hypothetical protein